MLRKLFEPAKITRDGLSNYLHIVIRVNSEKYGKVEMNLIRGYPECQTHEAIFKMFLMLELKKYADPNNPWEVGVVNSGTLFADEEKKELTLHGLASSHFGLVDHYTTKVLLSERFPDWKIEWKKNIDDLVKKERVAEENRMNLEETFSDPDIIDPGDRSDPDYHVDENGEEESDDFSESDHLSEQEDERGNSESES